MNDIHRQVMENQRNLLRNLATLQKAFFEGYEQLVDLNLQVIRTGLEEAAQRTAGLDEKQGFLAFASGLPQPDAEKMLAYGRQMGEIMRKLQSELTELCEEHVAQCQKQVEQVAGRTAGARKGR